MTDDAFLRGEVEPYIDKFYLQTPLLKHHRDRAIIHILRVLEDSTRLVTMTPFAATNQELQFHARLRWAHEAIPWALRWVWRDCPLTGSACLDLDWALYKEARELMELSFKYYHLCRYFILYSRGFFSVETSKERKRVRFLFRSEEERGRDAAAMIYSILQDHPPLSMAVYKLMAETVPVISTVLPHYIDKTGQFSIRCDTPSDMLRYFKRWAAAFVDEMKFQMPATWKFGDYDLDQFKSFWKSILTLALAHIQAHEYADEAVGTSAGAIGSLVMQTDQESLSAAAAGLFPVPVKTWRSIFDLLVYQPARNYWDPFWQPIIRISDGTLLISPHLVTTSSPERNLITLLTRSAAGRAAYNRVSSEKEREQLSALLRLFDPTRYIAKARVLVPRPDGTSLTDIDLFLYERGANILLLVHAKWLIMPDTVQEVLARDEEVRVALQKASAVAVRITELGRGWISEVLAIELRQVPSIYSVVVSRDFVPSGWVYDERIPAVNADFFTDFVGSPQFTGLISLHTACAGFIESLEKTHPVELAQREIQFGEYVFETPSIEFVKGTETKSRQ